MNFCDSLDLNSDYSTEILDMDDNFLDDVINLQDESSPFHSSYSDLLDSPNNLSPNVLPPSPPPSETNPCVQNCEDIPANPKEWLIIDQTSRRQRPPFLYEFLILLLHKPEYASYASYKDRKRGIFEISQPDKVAELWEQVKNRQAIQKMTYDKFARAIRWYYKKDIMTKTNARYTFQFSLKTLSCIVIDENNNITIHSPINSTTSSNENLDYLME